MQGRAAVVVLALACVAIVSLRPGAEAAARRRGSGQCQVDATPGQPDRTRGFAVGTDGTPPPGWVEADRRPADWDGDGVPDELEVAPSEVTVRWAAGSLTIDGLALTTRDDDGAGLRPAALADLTGDGWPDLVLVDRGEVLVVAGPVHTGEGAARRSATSIGSDTPGWRAPGSPGPNRSMIPGPEASVRPLWDLDGDGADDVEVVTHLRRVAGPTARYGGRRCSGIAPADGLSHRAGGRDPDPAVGGVPETPDTPPPGAAAIGTVSNTSPGSTVVPPTSVPPPPVSGRPSVLGVDAPDPTIRADAGTYRLYTTNIGTLDGGYLNVPVRRSHALWDWDPPTDALPHVGTWSDADGSGKVWAPTVHRFGDTWVLYYTARVGPGFGPASGRQCIGRATASSPDGPFVDDHPGALVCQLLLGGSIDPDVVVDAAGTAWLLFKNDGNCCGLGVWLWAMPLTADGLDVTGTATSVLARDQGWESPAVENPSLVTVGPSSWLWYSGGRWDSGAYATGLASCNGPTGPCAKQAGGPWLASNTYMQGPGGADAFVDANGRWWLAYHGWLGGTDYDHGGIRALFVDGLELGGATPTLDNTRPYDSVRPVPGPVTGLRATPGHNSAELEWVAPANADIRNYTIELNDLDGSSSCAGWAPPDQTRVQITYCLRDGHTYRVRVAAANAGGTGPWSDPVEVTPLDTGARFVGLVPTRVVDTRDGTGVDGGAGHKVGPGATVTARLGGRGGLPPAGRFSAVVLNVTVESGTTRSHLRAFPGDAVAPPNASNLNFEAGQTIAAMVTVAAASDGSVKLFNNSGSVHVIADVVGYYAPPDDTAGSLHRAMNPARVLDTRDGTGVTGATTTPVGAGQSIAVPLADRAGLPSAGAFSSVVLNVTAVGATEPSHLRVYPGDQAVAPLASNVNFGPGQTLANLVTVRAAADGTVRIYNQAGTVHVVADVVGYYGPPGGTAGGRFYPVTPYRVTDTRQYPPSSGYNPVPAGAPLSAFVYPAGATSPDDVSAAVLTITADGPSAPSHLTVWPSDVAIPLVSNLNFGPGQVIANEASVRVSHGGVLFQNNAGTVSVIIDLNGWFGPEASP